MGKEIPSELILPKISKDIVIGHNLIDGNNHANHAKQHGLYNEERRRYMEQLSKIDKDILNKFGKDPSITYLEGRYGRQLFEGDNVAISTDVKIEESKITFNQSIGENASSFMFVASGKIVYPENNNTSLYEIANKVKIAPEWTNEDGYMNVEGYLLMYEIDRTSYFQKIISDEEMKKAFELMPVVRDVKGNCKILISREDQVIVLTSAEDKKSHILITQRAIKDNIEISKFQFVEALVNKNNRLSKVPPKISAKLMEFNSFSFR
jgi:acyl-CoA thioesterase FadM